MNFHLVIFLAVVACALTVPLPDEEVSTLLKTESIPTVITTLTDGLVKSPEPSTSTAATIENGTKPDAETAKPTESNVSTTSVPDDNKKEEPKSLPVTAREGTAVVPLFAGARVEPKEGVEVGESKSSASTPDAEETKEKTEDKPEEGSQPTTEKPIAGSIPKQDSSASTSTEEKPKAENAEPKPTEKTEKKPTEEAEKKANDSSSTSTPKTESKESDKSSAKSKSSEASKEKHEHSSEHNKPDDSAESKESDESNESSNTK